MGKSSSPSDSQMYAIPVSAFEDLRVTHPQSVRTPVGKVRKPATALDPDLAESVDTLAQALREAHTALTGTPAKITDAHRVKLQRLIRGTPTQPGIPATTLIAVIAWARDHEFWSGKVINVDGLVRHGPKIALDRRFLASGCYTGNSGIRTGESDDWTVIRM